MAREDVKANDTIHISFGENKTTRAQGKILHAIKGLVRSPALSVDGNPVIKGGEIHAQAARFIAIKFARRKHRPAIQGLNVDNK